MSINTICIGCGKALAVADEHAGQRARCPACGHVFSVPLASTVVPSTAPENPGPLSAVNSQVDSAINWGSPGTDSSETATTQTAANQYWMRASDGTVYGPVDRENLDRWFNEGRVGIGYQIRQGETGVWQEASSFRPQAPFNPYAASSVPNYGQPTSRLHQYPKPDRGVLVLLMGILAFVICGVFGIIAVVMGRSALKDIEAGQANPNDKTLVQIGFWLGVINLVLHLLAIGGFLLLIVIGIISEAR